MSNDTIILPCSCNEFLRLILYPTHYDSCDIIYMQLNGSVLPTSLDDIGTFYGAAKEVVVAVIIRCWFDCGILFLDCRDLPAFARSLAVRS